MKVIILTAKSTLANGFYFTTISSISSFSSSTVQQISSSSASRKSLNSSISSTPLRALSKV